ncbi:hypothetical protein [Rhizobium sp. FKL33]|nr:hypothetical protein [Rhizobium sp. FKL33]
MKTEIWKRLSAAVLIVFTFLLAAWLLITFWFGFATMYGVWFGGGL